MALRLDIFVVYMLILLYAAQMNPRLPMKGGSQKTQSSITARSLAKKISVHDNCIFI